MKFKNNSYEEAYNYLVNLMKPDVSYNGITINQEKYNKYKTLCDLVLKVFVKIKGAEIDIEAPTQDSDQTDITIEISEFEMTDDNRAAVLKILEMSEHTLFYSNTLNSFCISLSVFNIWEE